MKSTILIVDDSEDTRELFKATLEAEGFTVIDAKDGLQALELLKNNHNFSLMLLDLSMPNMTGLQLLDEMENQSLGQNIPIMLVSAAKDLEKMTVPRNVIDSLKKPFFYPELIFKIKQLQKLRIENESPTRPLAL